MSAKKISFLFINIFTSIIYIQQTNGLCVPCPSDQLSFSFTNCECSLGTFYDNTNDKCVSYLNCPYLKKFNPVSNMNTLGPVVMNALSNSIAEAKPKYLKMLQMPKDISLISKAFSKRTEIVEKKLPNLIGPMIAPILLKNKNIFGDCKGKTRCIVMETLKKKENYNVIMPHIVPILKDIIHEYSHIVEDLEDLAKDCSYKTGCPLIRTIVDIKSNVPTTLKGVKDLSVVAVELLKYIFGDIDSYLPDDAK